MTDKTKSKIKVAAIRAARVFGAAFAGYVLKEWSGIVHGDQRLISDLVKVVWNDWDPAAGFAFSTSLVAFGVNYAKPISPEKK